MIAPLADIVLARVATQDAARRRGVQHRLQLGNSIGIALIGVIFFGIIGSQSGPAASAVAPALRSGVVAAGVPAASRTDRGPVPRLPARPAGRRRPDGHPRVVAGPAGQVITPATQRVLAGAGASAVRHDFVASLIRTLWFQVGVFLLSFLLMFALPRRAARAAAAQDWPTGPRQRNWPARSRAAGS